MKFAFFLSFLLTGIGLADELVLIGEGVDPAPLIVFPDAPPRTIAAAEELADYLERIAGIRPQVLKTNPATPPRRAVWIGYQPIVSDLFPGTDFEFEHPEEILIKSSTDHLFIGGRDRWDPENLKAHLIDLDVEGVQQEYGTVNAIYTFLQDHLGVRWLWPGELGVDVPTAKKVAISPTEYRYRPQIRARGSMFNYSQLGNRGYGRAQEWTKRQRLQLDSLSLEGGHGFADWWDRYHEKHPEIFALQPDGTRSGHPNPRTAKLCQSNPLVWDLWLKGVEEDLAKDPNRTTFNGSPNDGWSSGHCVCENCRAWDHPDGEPRLMHWYHYREERPALSDRHVTFANHLAGKLKQRYPDKDYYVLMLAYGHSRPAPVEARPAENVIMMSVANFYGRTGLVDRGSTWSTTHREQFAAWGKIAPHLSWRPNTGSPAGWQQGLPDLSVQQTIEDYKFIAENHCIGIYIDAIWEHWATHGPQYYMMAQLTWDPSQDADAVLDDYYHRAFGPAADEVRAYFEAIENARMDFIAEKNYATTQNDFPALYTDELLSEAEAILKKAMTKVEAAPENFARRIQFVEAGLRFTRLLVDTIALMNGYWDNPDEVVAAQVRENWKKMESIPVEHPYSINWGPIRPTTPRMLGLHPDHPNPKRKAKPSPRKPDDLDQN